MVTDDFQRIVLVEGPAVLGHEAWDELVARHGSNLLAEWLSRAVEQGRIAPVPIQPLTRLLIAMISESSLYIARADDRPAAREAMGAVLDRLLPASNPPPSASELPRARSPQAYPRASAEYSTARSSAARSGATSTCRAAAMQILV